MAGTKLIIGGTSGIGLETARQLIEAGETVVVASRDESRVERASQSLGCEGRVLDARSFEAVQALVTELGDVDGLACLAGSILLKPAHLTSSKELQDVLENNLFTAFASVRAVAKMVPGPSSLVLMSTVAAATGLPNHEAIAAAKGAVEALARSAAATYAGRSLRVNVVAPGLVETPMSERLTSRPNVRKISESMIPLGRIGQPQEVAHIVAWLLRDLSGWVTGQVFRLDGGLSALHCPPRLVS